MVTRTNYHRRKVFNPWSLYDSRGQFLHKHVEIATRLQARHNMTDSFH